MAHVMKHTKAACGHMFGHFDRQTENISNENLDRTRTHLNYNLATHQQMDQGEFVKKRCAEVHCQNRKDVNVMVSWVVTAPKDLPQNEEKAFFKAAYDFLEDRYGKNNVVSAYVHMDEVTPHMHFAFVPVTYDQKRDRYKVSAKEVVNRSDLKSFHKDLEKAVESALGHEVGILNEATKEGNRSIEELKRNTALEKLHSIECEIEAKEDVLERLKRAENDLKVIEGKVQDLEEKENALKGQIEANKKELLTSAEVKEMDIPIKRNPITGKEKVELLPEEYKRLKATAEKVDNLLKEIKPARKINAQTKKIIKDAENKAEQIITSAENKKNDIEKRIKMVESEYGTYDELKNRYDKSISDKLTLRREIETLKKSTDALQKPLENKIKDVENKLKGAYESLTNIVMAIGMLKYSESDDYRLHQMTPKQERLIDGLAEYGAKWAKDDGFPDMAEKMNTTVGLSKGIKNIIEPQKPQRTHHYDGPCL